jgi:hypothetical protein
MKRNRLAGLAALLVLGIPAAAQAQTFWDFVALNGSPTAPQGACLGGAPQGPGTGRCDYTGVKNVANGGLGSVNFSAAYGNSPSSAGGTLMTVFQWFNPQAVANDEKGVGVCRNNAVGAPNGSPCDTGGEIGESNGSNDAQWLILDLTPVAAGNILQSVTLASLTNFETWKFRICGSSADALAAAGATCTEYSGVSGAGSSPNILLVAIAAGDQSKKWLRFQAGAGAEGGCTSPQTSAVCHGDYLVQGITTLNTAVPEPGTMGLLATGLVALAGVGTLRRRNRNKK